MASPEAFVIWQFVICNTHLTVLKVLAGNCGRLAGDLLQAPGVDAFAFGQPLGFCFGCLGRHYRYLLDVTLTRVDLP